MVVQQAAGTDGTAAVDVVDVVDPTIHPVAAEKVQRGGKVEEEPTVVVRTAVVDVGAGVEKGIGMVVVAVVEVAEEMKYRFTMVHHFFD